MKEIILLNFGNYSNYVSTHFWNLNVKLIMINKLFSIFYQNNN